jgi:hypothetical protein
MTSDLSAEASSQGTEGGTQERASLRSVFGVTLGLLLVFSCLSTLLTHGTKSVQAGPALAERYSLDSLPFGFKLREQFFVLPGQERVFVIDDGSQPIVEELSLPDGSSSQVSESSGGEDTKLPPEEWGKVEAITKDGPPAQVFLVEYPEGSAKKAIERQFHNVQWLELKYIPGKGGRTAIDGGKIDWDGYAADFVLEREFRPGLKFTDRLRVNMTVEGQCWVAYCVWPDQAAGSEEPVKALLNSLHVLSE